MSNDCERDYVAIYRGVKLNKLVGKYCGRQAPPAIIFSADEALRIEFHTDGEAGNDDPTGFALKFYKVILCRILSNDFKVHQTFVFQQKVACQKFDLLQLLCKHHWAIIYIRKEPYVHLKI